MHIEKIKNNLTKIDASPNGIFFMSYNTPIAFIMGKEELITSSHYSMTTSKHKKALLGKHITRAAKEVEPEILGELAKKAGISCDW